MGPQFAHAVLEGCFPIAQMRCCMDSLLLYRPLRAHVLQRGVSLVHVQAACACLFTALGRARLHSLFRPSGILPLQGLASRGAQEQHARSA